MLQLYNLDKEKIRGLKLYKDYCIESELSSGDKTLSILYPSRLCKEIIEESYIRNKTNEFVVKSINGSGEWKTIVATLNVEDLEGKVFESFETVNKTITESLNLALAGTGWTIGTSDVTRRRTVRKTNSSSWEIIQEAKKRYRVDLEFDTLKKKINIFEKRGNDKGVYFSDSLNLKDLDIQGNSYQFYTRIIAIGKDDIRVTLDNFQYSKKVKTFIWKDERYTDIDSLREDAQAKLNEISKPYRAYAADVIDLSVVSEKHKILAYGLGDTVTLVSKDKGIREKQRIAKMIEYPDETHRNTCEIANVTLKFEDIQKEFQDATDTVNNITTDNGTIDGSTINGLSTSQIYDFEANVVKITDLTVVNAHIENLYAEKASIGELNAVIANIGELNATKANITELNAVKATITILESTTAKITDLTAINAKITVLEVDTASIRNLLAGNITGENIQAGGITSDKLTIANGFITNAMIMNLDVNKINAGTISTSKFIIKSDDGGIEIVGATQQFKDKNNKVRIQMGKDSKGDFNFILRGEDGTTTLIDHTGIKPGSIADDLIVKDMISSDAIGEKQIDYSSFATGFNKDTNTSTIKGTKIKLDNQNQTLDIAFNQLKSQADGTKSLTESNSTTIGIQQGQINTAINNTQIVKDGQTILLKDDYNRTVATVDSMKSTIGSHTSQIDATTGKINSVETKVNIVERDLSGTKSTVSANSNKIDGLNSIVSSQGSSITQLLNKIDLKVEATDITNALGNYSTTNQMNSAINLSASGIKQEVSNTYVTSSNANNIFATKASMELTSNQLKIDFSTTGGYNYTKNGRFMNILEHYIPQEYGFNGTNKGITVIGDSSVLCLAGRNTLQIRATNGSQGHYGMSQIVALKQNTTYTLSGYQASHRAHGKVYVQRNGGDWAILTDIDTGGAYGGKDDNTWNKFTTTFTTDQNSEFKYFFTLAIHRAENDGYCWFTDIMLEEGTIKTKYTDHHGELYSGNTVIDANGVTIHNGALVVKNKANKNVLTGDSNGNLWVQNNITVGGNSDGSIDVKKTNGETILNADKWGVLLKGGTVRVTGGTIVNGAVGSYPTGYETDTILQGNGMDVTGTEYVGSQVYTDLANYHPKGLLLTHSSNQGDSIKTHILNTGMASSELHMNSSGKMSDKINNAPWYGIGTSNVILGSYGAVQLAGNWGVRVRSNGCIMDFPQQLNAGISTNSDFRVGSNLVIANDANVNRWAIIPINGQVLRLVPSNSHRKDDWNMPSSFIFYSNLSGGHSGIKLGETSGPILKGLRNSAHMQIRNNGDTGYAHLTAYSFIANATYSSAVSDSAKNFREENVIDILKNNHIADYKLKIPVVKEVNNLNTFVEYESKYKSGFFVDLMTEEARKLLTVDIDGDIGVDQSEMLNMVWKVCQEQQKRIEKLEEQLQLA